MNVIQYLIDNARHDARSLRESHTPAATETDRDALQEARELDHAADLAGHALVTLGLAGVRAVDLQDDGN